MPGEGGAGSPSGAGAGARAGFQIDRDQVGAARELFQQAMDHIAPFVHESTGRLQVCSMARDDVSVDAARALNEKLAPVLRALQEYREGLGGVVARLAEVSARYREADEDAARGLADGAGEGA
ncbi:hypothetical protein [Streptoalloteichus hindustanus]|uniref:PE family protein n=1 Tax=Streptoalloteichus hindustanus TaxID=2017 RepID=A0A1M5PZX7_STRHI|nr:hypothetical protein [Streptoalloteichus hindustanus]SHH07298.1 hypothetical protein SAMN05444320_1218 [Streptoalloteichus hindustanus]